MHWNSIEVRRMRIICMHISSVTIPEKWYISIYIIIRMCQKSKLIMYILHICTYVRKNQHIRKLKRLSKQLSYMVHKASMAVLKTKLFIATTLQAIPNVFISFNERCLS